MHVDLATLRRAEQADVVQSLAFALRFNHANKIKRELSEMDASCLAGHLFRHLERCGVVMMKKPPEPWHSFGSSRTTP